MLSGQCFCFVVFLLSCCLAWINFVIRRCGQHLELCMYSEFAALAMFWFSLASTKKSEVSQRCGQRRCICTMYDVIDSLVMLFSLACIETTKTIVTSIKKLYIYIYILHYVVWLWKVCPHMAHSVPMRPAVLLHRTFGRGVWRTKTYKHIKSAEPKQPQGPTGAFRFVWNQLMVNG